jgi:hypothetical protein
MADQIFNAAGVLFPSTQIPSTNANMLDDYEEGTWTPGVAFGGGVTDLTYSAQAGYYTKIGSLVIVSGYMLLTNKGSSTGNAKLTGLPFTSASPTNVLAAAALHFNVITFADQFQGYVDANAKTISLNETTAAGARTNLTDANFNNVSEIIVSAAYRAA